MSYDYSKLENLFIYSKEYKEAYITGVILVLDTKYMLEKGIIIDGKGINSGAASLGVFEARKNPFNQNLKLINNEVLTVRDSKCVWVEAYTRPGSRGYPFEIGSIRHEKLINHKFMPLDIICYTETMKEKLREKYPVPSEVGDIGLVKYRGVHTLFEIIQKDKESIRYEGIDISEDGSVVSCTGSAATTNTNRFLANSSKLITSMNNSSTTTTISIEELKIYNSNLSNSRCKKCNTSLKKVDGFSSIVQYCPKCEG